MSSVIERESWLRYLHRITDGVPRRELASAAQVNESTFYRWLSGEIHPPAEAIITFARGLGLRPVELLVHAGYLEQREAKAVIEVNRSAADMSDNEFVRELITRLASRPALDDRDDITDLLSPGNDFE